jgi:hypothetical protein
VRDWRLHQHARIAAIALSAMVSSKTGTIFCCVHCAKKEGVTGLRDRD